MASKRQTPPPVPSTLADLAAAPYNPRTITERALSGLGHSLAEFGDIAGITWNRRTGHLVAGHQRVKSLRAQYGDLTVEMGEGEVGSVRTPEGHVFPVRVVDWPESREKAANAAANSPTIAGLFTEDLGPLLAEVAAEEPDLFGALDLGDLVPASTPPAGGGLDLDGAPAAPAPQTCRCPKCGFEFPA